MNDDFNFEIDDILTEFLAETDNIDNNVIVDEISAELEDEPSELFKAVYEDDDDSNLDIEIKDKSYKREKTGKSRKEYNSNSRTIVRERRQRSSVSVIGNGFVAIVSAAVSAILLLWVAVNIHPAASKSVDSVIGAKTDIIAKIDTITNNYKADAFSGLSVIKKIYKIAEDAAAAPMPNPYGFSKVDISNADKVMSVIQQARDSGLIDDDEKVIFNPNADFYYDSDIEYYIDETIMVICWKEVIDGNTCTLSEVKIADASQFRRKFVNDTFSADAQDYATNIARSVNAVVAMNADYYAFRNFGIVVYQKNLFRFNEDMYLDGYANYNCVDTAFIDSDGNFKFFHRGEQSSPEAMEKYIKDNNILFSIAFGPVLVENGELQYCDWYPAGEVNTGYSRAGIGQAGNLHYLYMSLNHSPEKAARWTVNQFAEHFYEKGVINAYCLDGGQTSEIVFMDQPYNYIDFNAERTVTDIIYFGTALDDWEGYF